MIKFEADNPAMHCPRCADHAVINAGCVICHGTGNAKIYGTCQVCSGFVYDDGQSAWCPDCDQLIAVTGVDVGSAA